MAILKQKRSWVFVRCKIIAGTENDTTIWIHDGARHSIAEVIDDFTAIKITIFSV